MKKLEVRLTHSEDSERRIGTLADQKGTIYFEWDPDYREDGLELSPFKLPLEAGLHQHRDLGFGPLHGLFEQSLPDGWGLMLMDRQFRRTGVEPASTSVLDRLAYLGVRTMGALTYHPSPDGVEPTELDLFELGENAERVFEGDAEDVLPELMRAGGSPGGARPKVLVGIKGDHIVSGESTLPAGYQPWMIKFASRSDVNSAGPIEAAYALMARAARVEMPETRLFEVRAKKRTRRYFGVRRFDRVEGTRVHVQSLANLIHVDYRIPNLDYAQLLRVTSILTRNHEDVLAAFRQMVFNVAAHVRDDHSKNFAFLIDQDDEWRLTPAYDVMFATGPGGEHTMTVNGVGKAPRWEDCLAIAEGAGIRKKDATRIAEEVNDAIARWGEFADAACCPRAAKRSVAATLITL